MSRAISAAVSPPAVPAPAASPHRERDRLHAATTDSASHLAEMLRAW